MLSILIALLFVSSGLFHLFGLWVRSHATPLLACRNVGKITSVFCKQENVVFLIGDGKRIWIYSTNTWSCHKKLPCDILWLMFKECHVECRECHREHTMWQLVHKHSRLPTAAPAPVDGGWWMERYGSRLLPPLCYGSVTLDQTNCNRYEWVGIYLKCLFYNCLNIGVWLSPLDSAENSEIDFFMTSKCGVSSCRVFFRVSVKILCSAQLF